MYVANYFWQIYTLMLVLKGFWVSSVHHCPGDTSAGANDDALASFLSNPATVWLNGHIPGWFLILITQHYKVILSLYWLDKPGKDAVYRCSDGNM